MQYLLPAGHEPGQSTRKYKGTYAAVYERIGDWRLRVTQHSSPAPYFS